MSFGEIINIFFSSLTKDLYFYQYIPLVALVTTVFVPVAIFIFSLLSLIVFNYEFSFFHFITFRKNRQFNNNRDEAILKKLKEEREEILSFLMDINEIAMRNDGFNLSVKSDE
jgi:hypothetical protein